MMDRRRTYQNKNVMYQTIDKELLRKEERNRLEEEIWRFGVGKLAEFKKQQRFKV